MKNIFKSLMFVAVAAMTFTACQKDNEVVDNKATNNVTYTFTAGFDETRASFGEKADGAYSILWDGTEMFKMEAYVASSDWPYTFEDADTDGTLATLHKEFSADNKTVEFTFEFPEVDYITPEFKVGEDIVIRNENKATSSYNGYFVFDADEYQTPTATSVDPQYVALEARFAVSDASQVDFTGAFEHLTAYGKLTIPAIEGVEIETVTIKLTDAYDDTKEYTLNVAELEEQNYWFACQPVKATKIFVLVEGSGKMYSYEKEFASGSELEFNAGHVKPIAITGTFAEYDPYAYRVVYNSIEIGEAPDFWNEATYPNVITLRGDDANDYLRLIINPNVTPIVPGKYVGLMPDWSIGGVIPWTTDGLEFDGQNSYYNLSAKVSDYGYYVSDKADVNISLVDGEYSIVVSTEVWMDDSFKLVRLSYNEVIE